MVDDMTPNLYMSKRYASFILASLAHTAQASSCKCVISQVNNVQYTTKYPQDHENIPAIVISGARLGDTLGGVQESTLNRCVYYNAKDSDKLEFGDNYDGRPSYVGYEWPYAEIDKDCDCWIDESVPEDSIFREEGFVTYSEYEGILFGGLPVMFCHQDEAIGGEGYLDEVICRGNKETSGKRFTSVRPDGTGATIDVFVEEPMEDLGEVDIQNENGNKEENQDNNDDDSMRTEPPPVEDDEPDRVDDEPVLVVDEPSADARTQSLSEEGAQSDLVNNEELPAVENIVPDNVDDAASEGATEEQAAIEVAAPRADCTVRVSVLENVNYGGAPPIDPQAPAIIITGARVGDTLGGPANAESRCVYYYQPDSDALIANPSYDGLAQFTGPDWPYVETNSGCSVQIDDSVPADSLLRRPGFVTVSQYEGVLFGGLPLYTYPDDPPGTGPAFDGLQCRCNFGPWSSINAAGFGAALDITLRIPEVQEEQAPIAVVETEPSVIIEPTIEDVVPAVGCNVRVSVLENVDYGPAPPTDPIAPAVIITGARAGPTLGGPATEESRCVYYYRPDSTELVANATYDGFAQFTGPDWPYVETNSGCTVEIDDSVPADSLLRRPGFVTVSPYEGVLFGGLPLYFYPDDPPGTGADFNGLGCFCNFGPWSSVDDEGLAAVESLDITPRLPDASTTSGDTPTTPCSVTLGLAQTVDYGQTSDVEEGTAALVAYGALEITTTSGDSTDDAVCVYYNSADSDALEGDMANYNGARNYAQATPAYPYVQAEPGCQVQFDDTIPADSVFRTEGYVRVTASGDVVVGGLPLYQFGGDDNGLGDDFDGVTCQGSDDFTSIQSTGNGARLDVTLNTMSVGTTLPVVTTPEEPREKEADELDGSDMTQSDSCSSSDPDFDFELTLDEGQGVVFSWSVVDATINAKLTINQASVGWMGVGFGDSPGRMVQSNAVIGMPGTNTVGSYDLTARSQAGVTPTAINQVSGDTSAVASNGVVEMRFTIPSGFVTGDVNGEVFMIWAHGDVVDGQIQRHATSNRGSITVDLGTDSCAATTTTNGIDTWVLYTHAVGMAVAWLLLVPVAVFSSIIRPVFAMVFGSKAGLLWFHIHRFCNVFGLLIATGAFVAAFWLVLDDFTLLHHQIGLAVMIAMWIQPLNAIFRPHLTGKDGTRSWIRLIWEVLHKSVGYIAMGLAMYNVYLGLNEPVTAAEDWLFTAYYIYIGVVAGLIVLMFMVFKFFYRPRVAKEVYPQLSSKDSSSTKSMSETAADFFNDEALRPLPPAAALSV